MTSHSVTLSIVILENLISKWEWLCDMLRSTRLNGKLLDCAEFDNGFYIIACLEIIARQWYECPQNIINESILQQTQERLDHSLRLLSDHFPLVCQAVWKVTILVEKAIQRHENHRTQSQSS